LAAVIISISPSLSISIAYTTLAPVAELVIICSVKLSEPLFSHHENVLSLKAADKTSISPSPSTSIANTSIAPLALVVIECSVKLSEPLFSHQAIVSSP